MEPIYLHEIDVGNISAFKFILPECVAGRDDIEITVEHGASPDNPGVTVGNIWARLGDSLIKAFICTESVPTGPDTVTAIVEMMNGDPVFSDQINEFVEHFSKQD